MLFGCMYYFALFFVMDQNKSPIAALCESFKIIKRSWVKCVLLMFVLKFILLPLGVITIIGWIWIFPVSVTAFAVVYQKYLDTASVK